MIKVFVPRKIEMQMYVGYEKQVDDVPIHMSLQKNGGYFKLLGYQSKKKKPDSIGAIISSGN